MTGRPDDLSYRVAVTSPRGETRFFVAHGLGLFGGTVDVLLSYLRNLGEGWKVGEVEVLLGPQPTVEEAVNERLVNWSEWA